MSFIATSCWLDIRKYKICLLYYGLCQLLIFRIYQETSCFELNNMTTGSVLCNTSVLFLDFKTDFKATRLISSSISHNILKPSIQKLTY